MFVSPHSANAASAARFGGVSTFGIVRSNAAWSSG